MLVEIGAILGLIAMTIRALKNETKENAKEYTPPENIQRILLVDELEKKFEDYQKRLKEEAKKLK